MRQSDVTKVEFLLTLNSNIIVQRFLNIKGINPDAKDSCELSMSLSSIFQKILHSI